MSKLHILKNKFQYFALRLNYACEQWNLWGNKPPKYVVEYL